MRLDELDGNEQFSNETNGVGVEKARITKKYKTRFYVRLSQVASLKKDFSKKTYHTNIVMLVSKTTDIEELAAYSKNLN